MATVLSRRLAAVLAVATLGTACGADAKLPTPTSSTTPEPSTTSSVDAPAPTTSRPSGGAVSPGSQRPSTTASPASPPKDNSAAIAQAADVNPGAFAGTLLAPGPAARVELVVLVQPGATPDGATLSRIEAILREQSGKPVTVSGPRTVAASGNVHTADEIRSLADAIGPPQGRDNTAVIYLLYMSGAFEKEGVLGVSVRGDTTAVFPSEIASAATPLVSRTRIERSVVTHEIGHLMGLVDLFLQTKRGDPSHPGHSKNRNSVMYWAIESSLVAQALDGPPPVDFDGADLADLAAIHSGAR